MSHSVWPRNWGFSERLVVAVTAPVLLMFVCLSVALYFMGKSDVDAKVHANGTLVVRVLAETAQYSVVSGNTDALERSVQRLLKSDRAIAAIEVLDPQRRVLVSQRSGTPETGFTFEQPIDPDVPDIDLFGGNSPHAPVAGGDSMHFRPGPAIGYVRVSMSSAPVFAEQQRRLLFSIAAMVCLFFISVSAGIYFAQFIRRPLSRVMTVLREIRQGHLEIRFGNRTRGEIGELESVIEEMIGGLSMKQNELEGRVASRTEELQQAMHQLAQSDDDRRRLVAHSNDLLEEQSRQISADIHDQFNASLLAIKLRASALVGNGGSQSDPEEVQATAAAIIKAVDQLYGDARGMVKRLRSEVLDTLGLRSALAEEIRTFNDAGSGCSIYSEISDDVLNPPEKTSIAAYRFVQEALNNIAKHSKATRARVVLKLDEGEQSLIVEVSDNGVGFNTTEKPAGFGLLGMRERISSVGGRLRIQSELGTGTRLRVSLPLA